VGSDVLAMGAHHGTNLWASPWYSGCEIDEEIGHWQCINDPAEPGQDAQQLAEVIAAAWQASSPSESAPLPLVTLSAHGRTLSITHPQTPPRDQMG
jgi:hypothetical protein